MDRIYFHTVNDNHLIKIAIIFAENLALRQIWARNI